MTDMLKHYRITIKQDWFGPWKMWAAHSDVLGEASPVGYGKTEDDALADLCWQMEEMCDA